MSAAGYPSPPSSSASASAAPQVFPEPVPIVGKQVNGSAAVSSKSSFVSGLLSKNLAFSDSADPALLAACAKGQAPKAFWLGCSDSRVSEGAILQAQLGEVFVHRNIANIFSEKDPSAYGAMTYALRHLGASHVLVVGHTSCGGCAAALTSVVSGPPITPKDAGDEAIVSWISPLIQLAKAMSESPAEQGGAGDEKKRLAELVERNVINSVRNVAKSEVVKGLWKEGRKIWVHGLVYDLGTGRLKDLGVTEGPPEEE